MPEGQPLRPNKTRGPRSLALHTAGGMVVFQVASFLATVMIARGLGPARQGLYHLLIATAVVAITIGKLGLDQAVAYLIPEYETRRPRFVRPLISYVVSRSFAVSIAIGGLIFLGADLLEDIFPGEVTARDLRYELGLLPALMLLHIGVAVLRGLGRSDLRAYIYYHLVGLSFLAGVFAIFQYGMTLDLLFSTRIVTFGLGAVASLAVAFRMGRRGRPHLPRELRRQLWSFGQLMVFVSIFQYVLTQPLVDLFVVGYADRAEMVGIYAVALKLGTLVAITPQALTIVVGPALAQSISEGTTERTAALYRRSSEWTARLSLLIGGAIAVLGFEALAIFGSEYTAGLHILLVLVAARAAMGCLGPNSALLLASGFVRTEFWLTLAALVLFMSSAVGLGLVWGAVGVALATGGSMFLLELARFLVIRAKAGVSLPPRLGSMLVVLGVSAGLGLATKLPLEGIGPVWVALASGLVFTGTYLGASKILGMEINPLVLRRR